MLQDTRRCVRKFVRICELSNDDFGAGTAPGEIWELQLDRCASQAAGTHRHNVHIDHASHWFARGVISLQTKPHGCAEGLITLRMGAWWIVLRSNSGRPRRRVPWADGLDAYYEPSLPLVPLPAGQLRPSLKSAFWPKCNAMCSAANPAGNSI